MGNLGEYEKFTTRAGTVGGVDKLVKIIESEAVQQAMRERLPKIIIGVAAGGIAVGAVLVEGGRRLYGAAKSKKSERAATHEAAEDARQQLRDLAVDDAPDADSPAAT